jgi:UDP-N-acetylmuramate dehydrogenase
MDPFAGLEAIIRHDEPLAPYTHLGIGGPAELLITPRSFDELSAVVLACSSAKVPLRVLGCGCNLLVRDEGIKGAVLRLTEPAFTAIHVEGRRVKAGTGAPVGALIAAAARHSLSGLETLVGIPGTVGGAIRTNAGDRAGDIGQFVSRVEVLDGRGVVQVRDRDEMRFGDHASNLDDPVLLSAEFALEGDTPESIVKRMRKAWIGRKASQPAAVRAAPRVFKDPRGLNVKVMLEQAGVGKTKVGGAEVNPSDVNSILVHPGATSRDVLRLVELMRARVAERWPVNLEQELAVW